MQNRDNRTLHVFISCAGDVEDEKRIVEKICTRLSGILLPLQGLRIVPIRWPNDVISEITGEGTQAVINDQIRHYDYDIHIGIMWTRFGDRRGNGLSHTEEEFEIALNNYRKTGKPFIQFYFKLDEFSPKDAYEEQQCAEVQRFRRNIRDLDLGIYKDFRGRAKFEEEIQNSLLYIVKNFGSLTAPKTSLPKTKYPDVKQYLARRACPKDDYGLGLYFMDKQARDTLDIISDCRRVALVSDAGMGKTTELQRIAAHFSKDESPYYPFLISLNKYVKQSLSELLPSGWEEIPESKIAVILDGLDEIESKNKRDAIRHIELFAEQHPETHIVVSCRTNFYESKTEQSSGTLSGFSSYMLLELAEKDVRDYVKVALDQEAESFHKDVSNNRLRDLSRIPFYLVCLVELFKKDHALPSHKADIFERLLVNRIEQDIEHYRTTIPLRQKQESILQTLERLAVGVEILGRNFISNDEYCAIIDEEPLRELIEHCTVWKKDDSEGLKWQFEHNNFQEYLAARGLANKPLSILKDVMFFKPDHRKLIPSWSNTLSFLTSIRDDQDLIEWVMDNEPEIAVRFERDKVETNTRVDILKRIFNHYKEKQIWINHDKFGYGDLAKFGQSNEILEFLLTELEKAEHYTTASNAIELLGHLEIPQMLYNRTCELLVGYAVGDAPGGHRALIALADLEMNTNDVVDRIVEKLHKSESEWTRYGLYYFLHNSDCLDDRIDVFLNGLQYVRLDLSSERSRLMDEHLHLRMGIEKAKSPNAIRKILDHFADNPQELGDVLFEESTSAIAENAATAYSEDTSLFGAATRLFEALIDNYAEEQASQFALFFHKTKTSFQLFEQYLSEKKDPIKRLTVLALLADEASIEFFVQQYQDNKLESGDVLSFRNHLVGNNPDLHSYFNDLINARTGNKFPLPQKRDYEKERKEKAQRDFGLLFDKEAFLRQIELIYETEGKDTLTGREILDVQRSHWDNPYSSNLATNNLRNLAKDRALTLAAAMDAINSWNWDWFCMCNVYKKSRNNKDIELTEEQEHCVAQWCDSNLVKVDFKTALETKTKTSSSASWPSIFLWYFLRKLSLKYPKEVLLDMISYDWIEGGQHVGIEYLESLVSKQELTTRVLQNLGEGIENADVLKNHFGYCKRYNIVEVLPFCQRELADSERGDDVRGVALETICALSPAAQSDIEEALPQISDDFKWKLIEKLVENDSDICRGHLLSLLETSDDEGKLRSAMQLVEMQDLVGLEYCVEWVKQHMKSPEATTYHDRSTIAKVKTPEAIPYLLELLEVCYQPDFVKTGFDHLEHHVLDALTAIALQESDGYQYVRRAVEGFIEQNTGRLQNVNFLNLFIERLDQKYYVSKSELLTITDVKKRLELVFGRTREES